MSNVKQASEIKRDPTLPPADRAVKYVLDLVQHDPNLYLYCGPKTLAFQPLCEAEAQRRGESEAVVIERRSKKEFDRWNRPEVEQIREELEDAESIAANAEEDLGRLRTAELEADMANHRVHNARTLLDELRTTLQKQMDGETVPISELRALTWRIEDLIGRNVIV